MPRRVMMLLVLVLGVVLGAGLTSWRAFPTEDMIARASCALCHDVHGTIEWEDAPFQSQVWLLGDLPEPTYLFVHDLFPYHLQERDTAITVDDLLARYGVTDYERVAFESLDGGLVMLDRDYITEESLLVPYLEGIRFKDEHQHMSTWLKGVRWIVVVGRETPLTVAGEATSMGRLLLAGERATVIAEGGDALYVSPLDGRTYRGDYARLYTGARLAPLLGEASYEGVIARDDAGGERRYAADEVAEAVIATVDGRPTLLLPDRSRRKWVIGLCEIALVP